MENETNTMTVVKDEQKHEQLIKKKEMPDSPFTVISVENKHFGTFGKYKITDDMDSVEDVEKELTIINWNKLVNIMVLVNEALNNKK